MQDAKRKIRSLNRRQFSGLAGLGLASLAGLPVVSSAVHGKEEGNFQGGLGHTAPGANQKAQPVLRGRRLREGDLLGLVLPASLEFEPSKIDLARRQLEALGFRVRIGRHAKGRVGNLAGSDAQRAEDINQMFQDQEIAGIVCQRGGWGTPRILPLLDYDAIRKNPKVIVGFSDITALINAIHQETGLITFHGPNGATPLRPYTLENFRRVLMSPGPIGTLSNPEKPADELVDRTFPIVTVRGGRATGPLVGGNLTLVAGSMGTPWEIKTDGKILLLEEVREELYRVDRLLTQLSLGGKFKKVAGVAWGRCSDCPKGEGPTFSFEQLVRHHFEPLGVPVATGLAYGHVRKMMTLPIGLEATFDADVGSLHFETAAVV